MASKHVRTRKNAERQRLAAFGRLLVHYGRTLNVSSVTDQ